MADAIADDAISAEVVEPADVAAGGGQRADLRDLENCFGPRDAGPITGATGGHSPTGSHPARWRRRLLSMLALALIAGAIWYLQSGVGLPFSGGHAGSDSGLRAGGFKQDGQPGFVTFESQGIKLGAASGEGPRIGDLAPDFTLLDMNGTPIRLSDLRGKTVVMNFWATWCPPCRQEFPELVRTYTQYADRGLVMLGVDLQESPDIVRSFANEYNAAYPIVIDSKGDVGKQYRLVGLPTTWFIDTQGVLRAQQLGPLTPDLMAKKLMQAGFTAAANR